jgi:ACR3 family arsenite efflux pump ArsB
MQKILNNIQQYLFFWILSAIIIGLATSHFFGGYGFSATICFLAALFMIYPSLVPLDFNKLTHAFKNKKIIVWSILFNFVLSPVLAIILGQIFLSDFPSLRLGLFLLALLPGGGMVTTWAYKSKTNMLTTLGIVFTNLIVAIFAVPFGVAWAIEKWSTKVIIPTGSEVCMLDQAFGGLLSCGASIASISPAKIIGPIVLIVIIPMILAYLTQRVIKARKDEEYFEKAKSTFAKISNVGLVIVLFILMSLKENAILFERMDWIIKAIVPLVIFYGVNLMVVWLAYKKYFFNEDGKALVWGAYLRYITLALGLAISFVYQNPELVSMIIIIILAYFIQIPSSFWLARKLQK